MLVWAMVLASSAWFPLRNHLLGQCRNQKKRMCGSNWSVLTAGATGKAELGLDMFSKAFLGLAVLTSHIDASSNPDPNPFRP